MKVISRSTVIVGIFYSIMAIFGYASTLGRTPEILIIRENLPGLSTDIFMMIAKICVMIVMVVNCVINYMPFRSSLYMMIYDHDDISKKHNLIITAVFFFFVTLIAIIFPKVTSILGIFGGLASTCICYVVPCKKLLI